MQQRSASVLVFVALASLQAGAQGLDSTPAERLLRVLAEMLPGHYSNANQAYFDGRRQLPEGERHPLLEVSIKPMGDNDGPRRAFLWREAGQQSRLVLTVAAEDPLGIRAEFSVRGDKGWRVEPARTLRIVRSAESFTGTGEGKQGLQLSARELWLSPGTGSPVQLERSREFHCYADLPGVGGGRDIPFERYDGITLHDQGGAHWFTTRDAQQRRLGISLLRVNWHVLNEANGNFNRNSLVVYVNERLADGTTQEHGYAFTDPDADRIGINLKWLLVNCAMTPRHLARPEM